jgi:hypothetical protein
MQRLNVRPRDVTLAPHHLVTELTAADAARSVTTTRSGPTRTDGKFFTVGADAFAFRGVCYGTFRPRDLGGSRFPPHALVRDDVARMADAGFTVVRTYTAPPDDVLDAVGSVGMRALAGVFYPDWRYLLGASRRDASRLASEARGVVRKAARRFAGDDRVFALTLGNEIPADVVRWYGVDALGSVLNDLVDVVHQEDPDRLVTYANYPSAEYLPLPDLDFLTFNVFLDRHEDLRSYLNRLHQLAGDRPLVLGELGAHVADGRAPSRRRPISSTTNSPSSWSAASPGPACSAGPTSGGWATQPSTDGASGSPVKIARRDRRWRWPAGGTSGPSPISTWRGRR